jgi:hypothetical protein
MTFPTRILIIIACFSHCVFAAEAAGAATAMSMARSDDAAPRLVGIDGVTRLVVDGRPMTLLAGELLNSSSSSLAFMEPIWPRLTAMNLNSVLASVSWELLEPREGQYDFTLVDGLLAGAREHQLRLVLIWFATYKNAGSSYAPPWALLDSKRFPRVEVRPGQPGGTITPLSETAAAADARAFAALMRHLREVDGVDHTVVMLQVENEPGILGAVRDHSAAAEQAFNGPVPTELTAYLAAHRGKLRPELAAAWDAAGGKATGSWAEVFGPMADEAFMAWHFGRFISSVARAGKAEYPLPMFANAWLVQSPGDAPGRYPSGGPVSRVHDVWRAAAPELDLLAPDLYLPSWARIMDDYGSRGNPLLIPESRPDAEAAQRAWCAIFRHNAIGFAPFGIDSINTYDALALGDAYRTIAGFAPVAAKYAGTDRRQDVLLMTGETPQEVKVGGLHLRVRGRLVKAGAKASVIVGGDSKPNTAADATGAVAGTLIAPDDHHLIVAGYGLSVDVVGGVNPIEACTIDEGEFRDGRWTPGRRLNGDERRIFLKRPGVAMVTLYP